MLLVLCLWSVSGTLVLAADPLVTCGRTGTGTAQQQAESCNFVAAVAMINTLIKYLIMISIPLAAVAFAYAGWLHLSAGDNSGQVTQARKIFTSVGIGFIIVLSGWLVFTLIAQTFLKDKTDSTGAPYGTYLN